VRSAVKPTLRPGSQPSYPGAGRSRTMSVRSGPYDGPILQQLLTCFPAVSLSCRNPAAPQAILPATSGGGSVFGRTFRGVNGCLIASISTHFEASLPRSGPAGLGKRDVAGQERPGRRSVEAVVDVRRAARRVARDHRRRDDVRLARPGPEEIRTARVSITSATVAGGCILAARLRPCPRDGWRPSATA
jgi:hypothetical protein